MNHTKSLFVLILVGSLLLCSNPALAQSNITVTQDEVVTDFPDKLTFRLSASSTAQIDTIKLLYRTNGATCQSSVAQQEPDFTPATSVEAEWEWDFTLSGILPPGAEVYWQWEITDAAGNSLLTEEQSFLVNDPRNTWKVLSNDQLTLQWYQGDQAFGRALQDIAYRSLERLKQNAGVSPTGQVWITVYPTIAEVQEVDIHTTEWAAGLAYSDFNSSIMAIAPGELEWAADVIPHELAHLVTNSVVFNCRGMWLPTWLSEGLAMYAEGTIDPAYNDVVMAALEQDNLPPLRSLERGFSSVSSEANRSYGYSALVVTYLIEQYGAQNMADLLAAIQSGKLIDKALTAVYGWDTDGLDAEWRVSLGYEPQSTLVPTSSARTAVPTIALFTSVVKPTDTPTSLPSPTSTLPAPTDTPQPPPTNPPTQSIVSTSEAPPETDASSSSTTLVVIVAAVLLLTAGGIILFVVQRKRRKSS